ncbi:MAG: double-strand break repair helicase AddA [Pseudomonadota bacterium]
MTAPDDATLNQRRAADPAASTWLSANAGSGKTRVLTDRVARLLLAGTAPENILCLTYTTAAAGEMQNRLFRTLGGWAMLDDAALREALVALGEEGPFDLYRARTLFARAIETPGGLKIQTIHSFCAALLRRFPLEAGVTPYFREMDDSGQRHLLGEVLEDLAGEDPGGSVSAIAGHSVGDDLTPLAREIVGARMSPPSEEQDSVWGEYGLSPGLTEADVLAGLGLETAGLNQLVAACQSGSKTDRSVAEMLSGVSPDADAARNLDALEQAFLTAKGTKKARFPTKATRAALSANAVHLDRLMDRVEEARQTRLALAALERTRAVRRFAAKLLPAYETAKQDRGLLDFDDLIERARMLLEDHADAQWVLYRLDGAIDHILVDEAQDTSPAQWRIVELLSREFGAGEGAREANRTLFVVGDKKQSIYSFQGADAQKFDEMRDAFASRLQQTGGMHARELLHSFRSSSAILRAVDAVFEGDAGAGLGHDVRHIPFFGTKAGRVDLWPVVPKAALQDDAPWYEPVDAPSPENPTRILANRIAEELYRLIRIERAVIPDGNASRPLTEGDVLVLVRGRTGSGDLFQSLIQAMKSKGLAVAGADRLKIAAELAVRDLTALLSFVALPEDDLSLAAALRSPLFGWTEDALFRVAYDRGKMPLWASLRSAAGAKNTLDVLQDLLRQADFLRPYELLERILVRHDGRRRLLARLGEEARDGIDALLDLALAYERHESPSLTGFLTWLEGEAAEVKRPADAAENQIQVMTIHGAKGLERPVVILADTLRGEDRTRGALLLDDKHRPHLRGRTSEAPALHSRLLEREARRAALERQRLLYVAMTRAENWLIVCGAGEEKPDTWYADVRAGLEAERATAHTFAFGEAGLRLETGDWSATTSPGAHSGAEADAALPDWVWAPAPPLQDSGATLSPSDLGGSKILYGETWDTTDTENALRLGRQIHLLLEHLPEWPEEDRIGLGQKLLTTSDTASTAEEAARLTKDVARLLAMPALARVFAADALAEVDVTAALPDLDGARIHGTIDRLVVEEDRVLAVDFKTNRIVPGSAEETPDGLLRQMGAYAAALHQIFPDRTIDTAILWTATGTLMPLPHDIVMAALRSAPVS